MADPHRRPNRRDALTGFVTGGLAVAGTVASANLVGGEAGEQLVEALVRRLSDLPALARGGTTSALARLVAAGAVLAEPLGPGQVLVQRDPIRALAVLPLHLEGRRLDVPVVATFARGGDSELRLLSVADGPSNPFDPFAAPSANGSSAGDYQESYDRLAATGGGVLVLPAGDVALNLVLHSRRVHLTGAGRGATVLRPRDPARPVLRAVYREGSWTYVTIANLDIQGVNGRGIGFAAGADAYQPGDEYAGRTRFMNVGFADLDIAVRRESGQIGLQLDQCGFGPARYHLHSTANASGRGEIMHAGVVTARDCHFSGAREAVAHIDSPVPGTGAVLFDNCIMERNPGFVFHVPSFPNVDSVTDFVVRDCWNELNATGPAVRGIAPCYGFFSNTGAVRFEGTPLGSLRLRNAVVATRACPLDQLRAVDMDAGSTLTHHDARGNGDFVPLGLSTSIAAAAQSEPPARALTFVIRHPTAFAAPRGGTVLLAERGDRTLKFVGSTAVVTQDVAGAVLPGVRTAQLLRVRGPAQLFAPPVAVPAGSWLVWLFTYRLADGVAPLLQISGDRGISARRPLDSPGWQTLGGMAAVAPGARAISPWIFAEDGDSALWLGGQALVTFTTRQAALVFLNAGSFPVS